MKSHFNLTFLSLLLVLFFNTNLAKAEAWPNEKESFENTFSTYYVLPTNSYVRSTLVDNVTFQDAELKVKKVSSRAAATAEFSYGLNAVDTFFLKFDGGYNRERFINTIKRNGGEQNVELDLDYFMLEPTVSWLRQLYRTDFTVISGQIKYFPGQFVVAENDFLYNRKLQSYEVELLLGHAFEANLGKISKLFGAPVRTRWHYTEWKASARQLPRLTQTQWTLDGEVGFRPADDMLAVFGLKGTWNGGSFARRPFVNRDVENYIAGTPLTTAQKSELTSLYDGFKAERSRFTEYQVSAKLSKAVTANSEISLQGISNVIKGKPLKNNVVVLSYEMKM